jgi:hypothetical protein
VPVPARSPLNTLPAPTKIQTATGDPSAELAARARAWQFGRDPRALWPALDPALLQPAADAIGRAVAVLVRGQSTALGSARGDDAYAIGVAALLTGTGPLLGYWVENGALDVSDAVAAVLGNHLAHGRARAQRIAREVGPALGCLVAAGVTPTIIKGFHTSYAYFAEPGLRPISDVDVLIAPGEVRKAEAELRRVGFVPSDVICKPYKRDWYPSDDDGRIWSVEVFDARDRWKLELHDGYNFGELPSFGLGLESRLGATMRWLVDGIPVWVPAQPLLTVALAAHIAGELHTRCLLRVVELASVIRRDRELGLLDWHALDHLLAQTRADRFVYPAFSLVEQMVPGTIDQGILQRARRASTPLARLVTRRLTPTFPVLDDRPILAERLMWIKTRQHAARSIMNWLNPVPDRPWAETLGLYHSRAVRALLGRASWMSGRGGR